MFCPVCRADYPADYKVCPKDATHLLASSRIGKYQIDALLGIGGMGAVYRAVNPDTRARVAIKLMNPTVAGSESARARFQREAAAVAALRTTHVVKVYDFGTEADGTLYLVMELLDGHPLRDEIRPAPERMELARVQMVLDGALKGLAAAHRACIVHRDLKPDNVFVADTDDGEVPKLLDFGIARVTATDSDLTRTGSLLGTAAYMAVEQVSASGGEVGPWSDVYAMGTILYEMLAGTPAFDGASVTEVLHRVLQGELTPLASVRPGLPAAIYELVERCTSRDPATRPRDAEAMRIALAAAHLVPPGTPIPPPPKAAPAHAQLGTAPTEASPGREASPRAFAATAMAGAAGAATSSMRAPASHVGHADTIDVSTADVRAVAASSPTAAGAAPPNTTRSPSAVTPRAPARTRWPLLLGVLLVAGVGGVIAVRTLRAPSTTSRAGAVAATHDPRAAVGGPPTVNGPTASAPSATATTATTADPAAAIAAKPPTADAPTADAPTADATAATTAASAPCDAQALRVAARTAAKARDYRNAIALAKHGLTCGGPAAGLHKVIVFAACKLGDDKLVMEHYYTVSRPRIEAARTICARQGTASP